jgi:multidrug efflux pump subunit AcrA (membrane-fusion protein)
MQVEVTLPNKDGVLLPGAYVQVLLPLQASKAMTIPTNALMIRGEGVRVATLDADSRVRIKPIKVGRNYGERVEVTEGVTANDKLVLNPSDSLTEGDQVTVAPPAPEKGTKGEKSADAGKAVK